MRINKEHINTPAFINIIDVTDKKIIIDYSYNSIIEYCQNRIDTLYNLYYGQIDEVTEYIWKVLSSNRFCKYPTRISTETKKRFRKYIDKCILNQDSIHIVLAGFPGKCANKQKVIHRMPDIGELAASIQLKDLDLLVQKKYVPGLKFSFMSDYVGLGRAFFPDMEEISLYVNKVNELFHALNLNASIVYITDIFTDHSIFDAYYDSHIQEYIKESIFCKEFNKLQKSIIDNIDIEKARKYYEVQYDSIINDYQISFLSEKYYLSFWDSFTVGNYMEKYFHEIIHASPVAYHPDKRLCLRLQCSKSHLAPWNGVGIINNENIYSVDNRNCIKQHFLEIRDKDNRFLGYIL